MNQDILYQELKKFLENKNISCDEIVIEHPKSIEHGDLTTNVALQYAKKLNTTPRDLAQELQSYLTDFDYIEKVEIAGPGFVNIFFNKNNNFEVIKEILDQKDDYGKSKILSDKKVNLEFVSANPTGPLHIGHTRWAAVGDALNNLLKFAGADVGSEYYFNDHGVQIDKFAKSLLWKAGLIEKPEDVYEGDYLEPIAEKIKKDYEAKKIDPSESLSFFREEGIELMMNQIKKSLKDFGVEFDVYFNESSLYDSGEVEQSLKKLESSHDIYKKDGALWFKAEKFGDEKDRVVQKANGEYAYFAPDIAYYYNKRSRGFNELVYMLGADHHGYVKRLEAVCKAYNDKPGENLKVLIGQMVNIKKGEKFERLSKRAGNMIYLEDLLQAVGRDALRYSLIRANINKTIFLDLDLITKASTDNPLFYIQYVYARSCSIERKAKEQKVDYQSVDFSKLVVEESEREIVSKLSEFKNIINESAQKMEAYRVCIYLEELAGIYHKWYTKEHFLPYGDEPVNSSHLSKLTINQAVKHVIFNGLTQIIGVSAPEKM